MAEEVVLMKGKDVYKRQTQPSKSRIRFIRSSTIILLSLIPRSRFVARVGTFRYAITQPKATAAAMRAYTMDKVLMVFPSLSLIHI